jgi:hypothetical protein
MPYHSGDDPALVADLRAALKRWRRATLGETALAAGLRSVERRQAADPGLSRAAALRQTVQAALSGLREQGRAEQADLLERRYLLDQGVVRLQATYHLSERSIYYRLRESLLALAHRLWAMEERDAEGAPAAPPADGPARARWRARHLPPPTHTQLFGADEDLAELLERLCALDTDWIVSLDGMGGMGKTALALEAARQLAETDRFADIAWVTVKAAAYSLDGPQPPSLPALTCGQVLDSIAAQLSNVDLSSSPLSAKREAVHDLLRSRPYLVVLDHLELIMDCGPLPDWLWTMGNPSKFLLTSRHWLASDVGLRVLVLDPLSDEDSLALIRHEARLRGLRDVVDAPDDALHPVLGVTGGNPLALKLVVGQLATLPLSQVLAALQSARPGADPFYRHLYRTSWELLSPPARQLLVRMAPLPESGGAWDDVAATSGLSDAALRAALAELTAHSLIQVAGLERKVYCLHPLTRHFVASLAARQEPVEEPRPEVCD